MLGRILIALPVALLLVGIAACAPAPQATPEPAPPSALATEPATKPSQTPTPTPTPTVEVPVFTECDQIITEEFQDWVTGNGWVGWNTIGRQIGYNPFEALRPGGLERQLACRWGKGPDVATDNVLDIAWAPLAGDAVEKAKQKLVAAGYDRILTEGGEYLAWSSGELGYQDEYGYDSTYLFTGGDVRWAANRISLAHLRPPVG